MIEIDKEKALLLLDQCVRERGEDYVYEKQGIACLYVHDAVKKVWGDDINGFRTVRTPETAKPGCMVGLALIKAGVPMSAFIDLEINGDGAIEALESLVEAGILAVTAEAESVFAVAQSEQDQGLAWGNALRETCSRFSADL